MEYSPHLDILSILVMAFSRRDSERRSLLPIEEG